MMIIKSMKASRMFMLGRSGRRVCLAKDVVESYLSVREFLRGTADMYAKQAERYPKSAFDERINYQRDYMDRLHAEIMAGNSLGEAAIAYYHAVFLLDKAFGEVRSTNGKL